MAGEMEQLAQTAIGQAIQRNDARQVRNLIRSGQNAKMVDRKGNTYLHFVSTMFRPYVFNVLAGSGIHVDQQNRDGNTALHVTALQDECCHVADLMACGADPFILNQDGKSAEQLACHNQQWRDIYQNYYPGLRESIKRRDMDRVRQLLHGWCSVHHVQNGEDIRQFTAILKHHDIIRIIDEVKFSLMAIHAVLELDTKQLKYAVSRGVECDVNFLQIFAGRHSHHILQHAIRLKNYKMVDILIKAGADVNVSIYIKDYYYGPLFFSAFNFSDPRHHPGILRRILETDIDVTAKDEKGRTCLIYAIDRRNGDVNVDVIRKLLSKGVDIATRDDTGCTARQVAMLARRHDIISVIDEFIIQIIKESEIDKLWHLACSGYEDFIVKFKHRDTWIYAAGNETEDATNFLNGLEMFREKSDNVNRWVLSGDLDKLKALKAKEDPDSMLKLVAVKDKAGRCTLLNSLLHGHIDVIKWCLEHWPELTTRACDNLGRRPLHYSQFLGEPEIHSKLRNAGARASKDYFGWLPETLAAKIPDFVEQERQKPYGLNLELHCLSRYEELMEIICTKDSDMEQFNAVLKKIKYPLAKFYNLFHPKDQLLVSNYESLLLTAIDHDRMDMAKRLVIIGDDCSLDKDYRETEHGSPFLMNAHQRAWHLGLNDLASLMLSRGRFACAEYIQNVQCPDSALDSDTESDLNKIKMNK